MSMCNKAKGKWSIMCVLARGNSSNVIIFGLVLVGLLFLPSSLFGQSKRFTVLITVPPVFGEFDDEAKSYLKRELRELADLSLVEKNADFFISVIPVPIKVGGRITGIAVSYVFEKGDIILHNVKIGSPDSLKTMCQKVIAEFDTYFVETYRSK